jgi:hypothetical protein
MSLPASGEIRISQLQTVMGGGNPIYLSEYYQNNTNGFTSGISGIPNIGSTIRISNFYGKSKNVLKTVNLTTGTFNAPGGVGAWVGYNSPPITIPSDFKTLVSWDLTFFAYKNNTAYGFAYPSMGINNVGGVGIAGSTNWAQSITRTWLNQTLSLGTANSILTCYIAFYTYANLSNCYFRLTIRYY